MRPTLERDGVITALKQALQQLHFKAACAACLFKLSLPIGTVDSMRIELDRVDCQRDRAIGVAE